MTLWNRAYIATAVLSFAVAGVAVHAQRPKPAAADRALQVQVGLDRAGFSPGEIDGKAGSNTVKALAAYKQAHKSALGTPEDAVLRGMPGASVIDTLVSYTITGEDVAGPYIEIPEEMADKAELTALGYSSLIEALGERFHAAPSLLLALNAGVSFVEGAMVYVPNVETASRSAPLAAASVVVSKTKGNLMAFDAADTLIFYAPVTSGSQHDPLPLGQWAVTAVLHDPPFNYDPDLFWNAKPGQGKVQLPPGPNGPVGVVWIDITKENYGLHGTPEPGQIGHSSSHGCVRLTNWDAATLASLVKKGTRVVFVQ